MTFPGWLRRRKKREMDGIVAVGAAWVNSVAFGYGWGTGVMQAGDSERQDRKGMLRGLRRTFWTWAGNQGRREL